MNYTVYKMNCLDNSSSPMDIDTFIFFSTFEERSWNIIEYLHLKRKLPKQVLALNLNDGKISSKFEEEKFEEVKFYISNIDTDLSSNLLPCLKDVNTYINKKNTIGIDISVMPTPVFTQILHFLFKRHYDKKIVIYYTEPEHYNLDNLFDFHALDGEIDIKAIPGFEGKTSQKNDLQRVIFYILGFEMNYLNKLIPQEINPDGIVPINGFPSYFPKYKDISVINNNVNYHEMDIQMVYSGANNPFETFNQMCLLKNKHESYCIDIIPAGTKPMALGACLFALKNGNNDIRILFPFPSEYKNQHSIGKGTIWEYIID